MQLLEIHSQEKQKLYDGTDHELYLKRFQMSLKDQFVDFTIPELERNALEDIKLSHQDMQRLVKESHLKVENILVTIYKSQEGLRLYYLVKNNTLYLFSFGEFQPIRYQLFFEGAWTIA